MTTPNTLPRLPLARYRLVFRVVEPLRLPDYAGSAWRGAFGRALKRLVCVTRERHCPDCLLYRSCAYPYIFETPPDPADGLLGKASAAPHPFVLLPDGAARGVHSPGETLALDLTLFGHGNRQLPYMIHALDQAGRHGIGADRGELQLTEVSQQLDAGDWQPIYRPGERLRPQPAFIPPTPACPERLRVTLHTPLRLRNRGHNVTPESFTFGALFANLLRRVSLLMRFHADAALATDFAGLVRRAHEIPLHDRRLRWQDWTRYSSRQQTTMQLGGVVGNFELDGSGPGSEPLEPFWPYLWLGQWTHAGKGTSMGLGCYRIAPYNPID
jgi:hypothetical protein